MIGGFEEPDEGAIYLGDRDVVGLPPYRRDVNTVFQSYALFPHLSIFDNVAFGLRRKGVDKHAGEGPGRRDAAAGRARGLRQAQAAPALGRPAAARRARPRAREPAAGAAARRAARRARPEAAQADAARAEADPARRRDHVRPRHARPGGGDDDGRRDRGHEQRPDRAARPADRALRAARDARSSPASSASPTCSSARSTGPARVRLDARRRGRGATLERARRGRVAVGDPARRRSASARRRARAKQPRRHRQRDRLHRRRDAVRGRHRRRHASSSSSRTTAPAPLAPSPGSVGHSQLEPDSHLRRRPRTGGSSHDAAADPSMQLLERARARRRGALRCPGFLAACGGGGGIDGSRDDATGAATGGQASSPTRSRISNWPLYIDIDEKTKKRPTLDQFTKETASRSTTSRTSTTTRSSSARSRRRSRKGQSIDRDIIVLTDWMAGARWSRLGYVEKLDKAAIPNIDEPRRRAREPGLGPEPRVQPAVAVGHDGHRLRPRARSASEITSIDELLEDPKLKGKVTLLTRDARHARPDHAQPTASTRPRSTTATFDKALDRAAEGGRLRPDPPVHRQRLLRPAGARATSGPASAWSGDMVQLQPDNPNLKFVIPEAGGDDLDGQHADPEGRRRRTPRRPS